MLGKRADAYNACALCGSEVEYLYTRWTHVRPTFLSCAIALPTSFLRDPVTFERRYGPSKIRERKA